MSNKLNGSQSSISVRKLVIDALLIAMYFALSLVPTVGSMKFTFEGLPIIIGALLYGPIDGMTIGLLGSFLNQMITYGFTPTTILWILPHGIRGLIVGVYARRNNFDLTQLETVTITVISALVTTTLNTAVMYIDAKLMGYYSKAYVFGSLVVRYISGVIIAIIYAFVLPPLFAAVKRYLGKRSSM